MGKAKDAPLTRADLPEIFEEFKQMMRGNTQTILDEMRKINRKVDDVQDDLNQVKRDVSTIAKNTKHTRDAKTGQLKKTA